MHDCCVSTHLIYFISTVGYHDNPFFKLTKIGHHFLHQGILETVGKTKEIFDNPGTVNAARLTGCKNISKADKLSESEFLCILEM